MTAARKKPKRMVHAERGVTVRDFGIFVVKLLIDGSKDIGLIWLSGGAIILDIIAGRGKKPRLFYSVLRISERFDLWLNLNGAMEKLESGETDDGLFGANEAGSDSLLGKIQQLVRGGDKPRSRSGDDATRPEDPLDPGL